MAISTAAKAIETREKLTDELKKLHYELIINQQKQGFDPDPKKQKILDADIICLERDIGVLQNEIDQLDEAIQEEKDAKFWSTEKDMVMDAVNKFHIGYLPSENRLIYCKDMGSTASNAIFKEFEAAGSKPHRTFNVLVGKTLKGFTTERLLNLMERMGKSYLMKTVSFSDMRWSPASVYNEAKVIMNFWVQPNMDEAEAYNRDFDVLMHCVGGGKQENIEHLEKWILYKYMYPERVGNIPNLDIGGQPGGNGKGRFVKLCETIFTPTCVISAVAAEMKGFNANWSPAVVLHYDEPEENELRNAAIKNVTGSETQRIEKKGIDAYMADRNFSLVFTSNNENGVVKLSGNRSGEDRRYSVMITNLVMVDYIMETEGVNFDTAKERVNSIAQLVKDKSEVAKWLGHIWVKHPDLRTMDVLQPLHGDDYNNRFEDQKTVLFRTFDAIYPVMVANGFIPLSLLLDLVHLLTDDKKLTSPKVRQHFESYLKNKKHLPVSVSRAWVDYQFNGVSSLPKKQRGVLVLDSTAIPAHYDFDYSMVYQSKYEEGVTLQMVSCTLSIA